MNASEFVNRLKTLAPAKPVLLKCDYTDDEADDFMASFGCHPRGEALNIEANEDAMLTLIREWDLSTVEIGPISFSDGPAERDGYLEIAAVEGDPLVYRPESGDYVLLDAQNRAHVMCEVAPNGNRLLDGLIEVASYYAKTAVDEVDIDDEAAGAEAKVRCIDALGGIKYNSFCTSILGR